MENTNFSNASGINDPYNYSTVRDILIMSNYLIKIFLTITSISKKKNLRGIELGVTQLLKVIETRFYIKILVPME